MKTTIQLIGLFLFGIIFPNLSAQNPDLFVTSRNTNSVKRYDGNTGVFKGDFVSPNSGGLNAPQEVLFHPSGDFLVTGRFNTAVKRYDGSTGAYKGNFTTGYILDNPTKTQIGPDGKMYISQWGTTKNKVVQFDFETGEFIKEYTSTGVPTGCGLAWDENRNLYVARWGSGQDGNIHKFDSLGNFVEVFINSDILQGPTNIWFGDDGYLWVADWSVGDVLRFDIETKQLIDKPITTMQTVEGFAFDGNGFLFLGDWNGNAIYRFNLNTSELEIFANSGGISAPNSVTFGPMTTNSNEVEKTDISVNFSPNPVISQAHLKVDLSKSTNLDIRILDAKGALIKRVGKGHFLGGNHSFKVDLSEFSNGHYFYEIEGDDIRKLGKFIILR